MPVDRGLGRRVVDEKDNLFSIDDVDAVEKIVTEKMQYKQIPTAVDVTIKNFQDDPLLQYLYDGQGQQNPLKRVAQRASVYWVWYSDVKNKFAWTVHGDSFMTHLNPRDERKKCITPLSKAVSAVLSAAHRTLTSEEGKRRLKEFEIKKENAIRAAFGEKVHEMLYIENLITVEEARGRGCASALIQMVFSLADEQSRETWLLSSNIANVGFYESLGFHVITRFSVGESNPNWTKMPVLVDVMVRYPRYARRNQST